MAGIILRSALKDGEKFTGRVVDVTETMVIFETKDGKKVKLPLPEDVRNEINDSHNHLLDDGDIITITRKGDDFEIEELDEWPKEK